MPRIARVVVPGVPHHVTQRGHRREDVFFTAADRRRYLALLSEYAAAQGLGVHAWCLMTNHVHLVAVPEREESLAAALRPVHLRYAQHVIWTQGVEGRIWQGRFHSCPLDNYHYWAAVRYVEQNPVRAGLVEVAEGYEWSSAAGHCGLRDDPLTTGSGAEAKLIDDWSAWLRQESAPAELWVLRGRTRTGRPAGSEEFVGGLEVTLGRRLRAEPRGRPRKRDDG